MTYRVQFKRSAEKTLAKLPRSIASRLFAAAMSLADDPRPAGAKKLVGSTDWRIRVGDYRIVYTIEDDVLVVEVVNLGHHRDIYRR